MPVSIGMDTTLYPVQNSDLQRTNYGRLRKLFYKATCNPLHYEQSLSHIPSMANFPSCILIQYRVYPPHFKNTKDKK